MTVPPHKDQPAGSPAYAVETGITRQLEDEYSRATLEVTPEATADDTLLVGFGGHWGTTTTELTPAEAREFAHALEQAADHLESDTPTTEQSSTTATETSPNAAADAGEKSTKTHDPNTASPTAADHPEESDE